MENSSTALPTLLGYRQLLQDRAGGMVFGIADNRHLSAIAAHNLAFRDSFTSIVCALGMNIRLEGEEQFGYRGRIKNRDIIDTGEPGNYLGPLPGRHHRPALTF